MNNAENKWDIHS